MGRGLKENGLSVVLFTLFLAFLIGQCVMGHREYNSERQEHGQPAVSYAGYLASSYFAEATFENWESEFLQMGVYVLFTVFLFQKGSSESKRVGVREAVDAEPKNPPGEDAPWPVRKGGWVLKLYKHSLSLAFLLLFLVSFALHAVGGAREYNEEQLQHGGEMVSMLGYITTARFWFESFQNWQSEFLAIGSMVALSVFLRQQGSPESKPVDAPHSETGG